jgi:hypothetical protein
MLCQWRFAKKMILFVELSMMGDKFFKKPFSCSGGITLNDKTETIAHFFVLPSRFFFAFLMLSFATALF